MAVRREEEEGVHPPLTGSITMAVRRRMGGVRLRRARVCAQAPSPSKNDGHRGAEGV